MAPRPTSMVLHPLYGYPIKPPQEVKTLKRNERERNRVEAVNRGFDKLRQHIPQAARVKKRISKVNIVIQALEYIHNLQSILAETEVRESEDNDFTQQRNYHVKDGGKQLCEWNNSKQF